jgi:transposase
MPKREVNNANRERRLKMKMGGMTYAEIGRIEGISKVSVYKQINHLIPNEQDLEIYKKHRADILASKQVELLQALTPDKIKDASALQLITGMGILTDKERLERGQSTQNVETVVQSLSSDRESLLKEIEILRDNVVINNMDKGENNNNNS